MGWKIQICACNSIASIAKLNVVALATLLRARFESPRETCMLVLAAALALLDGFLTLSKLIQAFVSTLIGSNSDECFGIPCHRVKSNTSRWGLGVQRGVRSPCCSLTRCVFLGSWGKSQACREYINTWKLHWMSTAFMSESRYIFPTALSNRGWRG